MRVAVGVAVGDGDVTVREDGADGGAARGSGRRLAAVGGPTGVEVPDALGTSVGDTDSDGPAIGSTDVSAAGAVGVGSVGAAEAATAIHASGGTINAAPSPVRTSRGFIPWVCPPKAESKPPRAPYRPARPEVLACTGGIDGISIRPVVLSLNRKPSWIPATVPKFWRNCSRKARGRV